jgi:hypothetical protein
MLTNDEMAEAAQIRAKLDRALTAAISAQGITSHERNRQRARAIISARQDMAALRARSAQREQAEQAKHYKAAFGIRPDKSAEDRAYRDSLAARNLSASDARQLFAQAEARGDDVAMTAIAELAWQNGDNELDGRAWSPILNEYGASKPQYDTALTAMSAAANPDRMAQFRDKAALEISQPRDLRGSLEALAADDQPASGGRSMGMQWDGTAS